MRIPWWVKLSAKLVLSRLPVSYASWFKLGAFRHGYMGDYAYARQVFDFHREQLTGPLPPDAVCLELGPGDSLFTAITAHQAGFARSIMIDAGRYADGNLERFGEVAREAGIAPERVAGWRTMDAALADLNARYLTNGLEGMRSLPDASVHLIFSQAVLEHIRRAEYAEFVREMKRVLAPGGIVSHQVDLQEHLEGGLYNLRFSDAVWESPFFAEAGFYTNRLACSEHRRVFEDAGFAIRKFDEQRFPRVAIRRGSLAPQFADRSDEDLSVLGFHIVAGA
jgi:SAM-dependent methyltransferase